MTEPQRIHWQLVIAQIRSTGRSYGQVSIATRISKGALKSLARSGQPTHLNGEIIIRYWCDRMGLGRDCLPKVGEVPTKTILRGDQSAML